jgi:hypothetical protein
MDPHFGTVPHLWVLPFIKHEANVFMNFKKYRSKGLGGLWFLHLLFKRGKDLSCTHVSGYKFPHTLKGIGEYPPLFLGGIYMDIWSHSNTLGAFSKWYG